MWLSRPVAMLGRSLVVTQESSPSSTPLADRRQFPVTRELTYLNHASVSPLPRQTAEAMASQVGECSTRGTTAFPGWDAAYRETRSFGAKLIGAGDDEIALVKNTSEGLSFVANGLDWRPGDVAVVIEDEFPANLLPWKRLVDRGVRLRTLHLRNGAITLSELDEACAGARLLAVSFVQYLGGFRLDLDALGEICERRGCLLVVDAVQGLGPLKIDVKSSRIHALSASAHKWLLGPEGIGLLYVDRDLIPQIDVLEMGWTNVEGWQTYNCDGDLRAGATRFECGTLNTVGCYGLRESLRLFLETGVDQTQSRVTALSQNIAERAAEKGYVALAERAVNTTSGIISIRKEGVDAPATARALEQGGIIISPRSGWLRAAPHFYNTEEEADRFVAALP